MAGTVDYLDLVNTIVIKTDIHTNHLSQILSLEISQFVGKWVCKSEGRDAAYSQKSEVNSSSVTAIAQTGHQAFAN